MTAYDPFDREFRADPYPGYAQLRERCPVHHVLLPDVEVEKTNANPIVARPTKDFYSIARYCDVLAVLQDNHTFSSAQGPGPERLVAPDGIGMLIYADEPHHARQRRIVVSAFQPKVINPMRPAIQAICDRLIDGFAADGHTDVVPRYATQVPIEVTALILGVTADDREKFKRWTDDTLLAFGGDPDAYERSYQSLVEFREYFTDIITARRAALARGEQLPGDVLTRLIDAEYEERQFTDDELLMAIQILLLGGVDTVNHALGNGVQLLLSHSPERELLAEDPARWTLAIEEILRFEPPAQALFRTTSEPTEVAGHLLPADAKVRVLYASANRDSTQFGEPDTFRIDRAPREVRRHMAFGHGIHACLGAHLGRTVLEIALRTLFDRLPGLRLDPDRPAARELNRFHTRSWATLPVRWDT
jgi:cytochrome P450